MFESYLFFIIGGVETFFDHYGRNGLASDAHAHFRAEGSVTCVDERHRYVLLERQRVVAGGDMSYHFIAVRREDFESVTGRGASSRT